MKKGEQAGRWDDDDDGSRGGELPEYFAFRRVSSEQEPHTHTHTHTSSLYEFYDELTRAHIIVYYT